MAVYKTIELVSTSEKHWGDALKKGYEEVKKTIRGIRSIQTVKLDVKVKEETDTLIYRIRFRVNFEIGK